MTFIEFKNSAFEKFELKIIYKNKICFFSETAELILMKFCIYIHDLE